MVNRRPEYSRRMRGDSVWAESIHLLVAILALISLIILPGIVQAQSAEIILAGYNHVPTVRTSATGVVTVTVEADTLIVEGQFRDLRGVYRSASIHYGPPDESGNRLFGLNVDLDEDRKGGMFSAEKNRFGLRPSLREALKAGNLYISVASNRHQRGEIRGQIPAVQ
ncbi:MAG: CHRD domain-containing protein [Balneolaceae bacterium]